MQIDPFRKMNLDIIAVCTYIDLYHHVHQLFSTKVTVLTSLMFSYLKKKKKSHNDVVFEP